MRAVVSRARRTCRRLPHFGPGRRDPSLNDLGYGDAVDTRGDFFDPRGGEAAALERLQRNVRDEDRLRTYFDTRNGMVGQGYSTKFAPWLARGCLSPRRVAHGRAVTAKSGQQEHVLGQIRIDVARLLRLLRPQIWREALLPVRRQGFVAEWRVEMAQSLEGGADGRAARGCEHARIGGDGLHEQRGRQNVASYLIHDLGLDWRLGAEHFEELLVDYMKQLGQLARRGGLSGGRINFNILKQSKDYDANGEYVKLWCPELEKVPAPSCHAPWLLSSSDKERLGVDYPPPLKTLGFKGGGKKGPPPKKAKGGDRDKIKAKRRQKSRVQASYL